MFLSNRVHPDGHGDVVGLRARVASIVASAITDARVPPGIDMAGAEILASSAVAPAVRGPVQTGIDALRAEGFARLNGRHVGLLTNQSGRAADGVSTIDLLHDAKGITLVALFSPEHGIRGVLEDSVPSTRDEATGLRHYAEGAAKLRQSDDRPGATH